MYIFNRTEQFCEEPIYSFKSHEISEYYHPNVNFYCITRIRKSIIRSGKIRWKRHVARTGERRDAYGVLVGQHEGRRPLGRLRSRWNHNIKINLREVG
jgi:hypothetical protein